LEKQPNLRGDYTMKKTPVIFISVLVLLLVDFSVGYFLGKKSDVVTVQVENGSQKDIAAVTVEYEGGTVVISDIKKKKRKKLKFLSKKENSYKLQVIFKDNVSLYSEKRNVKPGSGVKETVLDNEIKALH
jgi:hypothetical protein